MARPAQTFVNVRLALEAGETGRTVALVGVDTVETTSAIVARKRGAIVDVRLALHARVSSWTVADVAKVQLPALAAILARQGEALVDFQQSHLFELFRRFRLGQFVFRPVYRTDPQTLDPIGGPASVRVRRPSRTSDAEFLAVKRLIESGRTGETRSQSRLGDVPSRTDGLAVVDATGSSSPRSRAGRASDALPLRVFRLVRPLRASAARPQSGRRIASGQTLSYQHFHYYSSRQSIKLILFIP